MTEEEITGLARQAYRGDIFTSLQVRKEDHRLLPSIFMVLALMDGNAREEFVAANPGMLYAPMAEAVGSRGINGYPCFFELNFISVEETRVFIAKYNAIIEAVGKV